MLPPAAPVAAQVTYVTPEVVTDSVMASLNAVLAPTALRIYRVLHQVALRVAVHRGYAPGVSCVTYHLPTELLAFELNMSRTTLWTHVRALKDLGLVDQRGHTTTHKGRNIKDGSLWSIKLLPNQGKRARLTYDDFKHKWRDLTADIEAGRTVYNWTEQSVLQEQNTGGNHILINWALTPGALEPTLGMTVQREAAGAPETLLDVPCTPRNERNGMVDTAARSIASYLGDPSVDFYRFLLWQLLRRLDENQGQNYFHAIYNMVIRVGTDRQEGFARRPGALLTQRLKDAGLWEWIREALPLRVGSPPAGPEMSPMA